MNESTTQQLAIAPGRDEWGQSGFAHIEMLEDGPGACYMYYVS